MSDNNQKDLPESQPAKSENNNNKENTGNNESATRKMPFNLILQYIKDVSFESPAAPAIFRNQPQITPTLDIDVSTQSMGGRDVLVSLKIEVKALTPDLDKDGTAMLDAPPRLAYLAELTQSAIVRINDIPKEAIASIVMVEVPILIYPFLRASALNLIREGGFAPPVLPVINFLQLAKIKAERANKKEAEAGLKTEEQS